MPIRGSEPTSSRHHLNLSRCACRPLPTAPLPSWALVDMTLGGVQLCPPLPSWPLSFQASDGMGREAAPALPVPLPAPRAHPVPRTEAPFRAPCPFQYGRDPWTWGSPQHPSSALSPPWTWAFYRRVQCTWPLASTFPRPQLDGTVLPPDWRRARPGTSPSTLFQSQVSPLYLLSGPTSTALPLCPTFQGPGLSDTF